MFFVGEVISKMLYLSGSEDCLAENHFLFLREVLHVGFIHTFFNSDSSHHIKDQAIKLNGKKYAGQLITELGLRVQDFDIMQGELQKNAAPLPEKYEVDKDGVCQVPFEEWGKEIQDCKKEFRTMVENTKDLIKASSKMLGDKASPICLVSCSNRSNQVFDFVCDFLCLIELCPSEFRRVHSGFKSDGLGSQWKPKSSQKAPQYQTHEHEIYSLHAFENPIASTVTSKSITFKSTVIPPGVLLGIF